MALVAPTQSQSKRPAQPPLDPGSYPAIVARVIDLGLQPTIDFTTKEPGKPKHMIQVTYELVDAFMVDEDGNELPDKPRWISEEFPLNPLTSDLATSTKRIKAIDPAGELKGDWSKAVGKPCTVVTANYETKKNPGVIRDKVSNVTAMRARDIKNLPEPVNDLLFFDLSDPSIEVFKTFPEWLQDKIKGNLEFKGSALDRALNGDAVEEEKPVQRKKPDPEPEPQSEDEDDGDAPW